MRIVDLFSRQPRAWILLEIFGALAIIGVLDYSTSYELPGFFRHPTNR